MQDAQPIVRKIKTMQHCSSCLNFLHNYFDDPIKLFLDLYLSKFLATSGKSFLPCIFSPQFYKTFSFLRYLTVTYRLFWKLVSVLQQLLQTLRRRKRARVSENQESRISLVVRYYTNAESSAVRGTILSLPYLLVSFALSASTSRSASVLVKIHLSGSSRTNEDRPAKRRSAQECACEENDGGETERKERRTAKDTRNEGKRKRYKRGENAERREGGRQQTAPFPFIFVFSRRAATAPRPSRVPRQGISHFFNSRMRLGFWTRCIQNSNSTLITCTRPFHLFHPIHAERRSYRRNRTSTSQPDAVLSQAFPKGLLT